MQSKIQGVDIERSLSSVDHRGVYDNETNGRNKSVHFGASGWSDATAQPGTNISTEAVSELQPADAIIKKQQLAGIWTCPAGKQVNGEEVRGEMQCNPIRCATGM